MVQKRGRARRQSFCSWPFLALEFDDYKSLGMITNWVVNLCMQDLVAQIQINAICLIYW